MPQSPITNHHSPSLPDDVVLRVDNVSKKFCRNLRRSMWYGIQDLARNLTGIRPNSGLSTTTNKSLISNHPIHQSTNPPITNNQSQITNSQSLPPLRQDEFWALQNISFDLKRGECLGLIGKNGCGKTTLLRVIAGIFPPDHGLVAMRGRVSALIALGAGFHPHMTGKENVYLNGAILGLHRHEIDKKLDDIIDFAGIGKFIDAPVTTYSSGMKVRLGFAVATAVKPDLLIIDEVLAVGDAAFRNKCYNRIGDLRHVAATIFVSHSMEQVAMVCDKALFLKNGVSSYSGDVDGGILAYDRDNDDVNNDGHCFESVEAPVTSVNITLSEQTVEHGGYLGVKLEIRSDREVRGAILRIVLYDERQVRFAEWNSAQLGHSINLQKGQNVWNVNVGPMIFKKAVYKLGIALNDNNGLTMLIWSYKKHQVAVDSIIWSGPAVVFKSEMNIEA